MVKYDSKALRVDADFFKIRRKKSPFSKILGYVWMVKYDSKTLRVDADSFFKKYGGKNLRFRKYPATCGRGLSRSIKTKTSNVLEGVECGTTYTFHCESL